MSKLDKLKWTEVTSPYHWKTPPAVVTAEQARKAVEMWIERGVGESYLMTHLVATTDLPVGQLGRAMDKLQQKLRRAGIIEWVPNARKWRMVE